VFAAIDAGVHPLATHIETGPLVHVVNMVDRLHSRDRRCAALDPRSRQWRAGGEDRDGDHAATGTAGARDAQYPGPEPEALPQQGEIDFARIRAATPLLARRGMLKDATSRQNASSTCATRTRAESKMDASMMACLEKR
jgi:hypothetical protein